MRRAVIAGLAGLSGCCLLGGCESGGSTVRNIEVTYRFENLRKTSTLDEWAAIKPILDRNSARPVVATPSNARSMGSMQLSNMEAKCVLPTLTHVERVQTELESLRSRGGKGDRVEVYLSQMAAGYKTNFVAATASVTVSGIATRGNRVRLFSSPAAEPVEVSANSNGVWVAKLNVVPEANWVYGVSEDPSNRVPPRYFRINIATKAQERLEESEFVSQYPNAFKPKGAAAGKADTTSKPMETRRPSDSAEERRLQEQRRKEDEEFRRRRAEAEKRRSETPRPDR